MTCYLHPEIPSTHDCHGCGKPMCYQCSIEEKVASRVMAASSIDRAIEIDYGFFCPDCYIRIAHQKGYDGKNPAMKFIYAAIICWVLMAIFLASGVIWLVLVGVCLIFPSMVLPFSWGMGNAEFKAGRKKYLSAMERTGATPPTPYQQRPKMVGTGQPVMLAGPPPATAPPPATSAAGMVTGAPVGLPQAYFCSGCGNRLPQGAVFCSVCGRKIG